MMAAMALVASASFCLLLLYLRVQNHCRYGLDFLLEQSLLSFPRTQPFHNDRDFVKVGKLSQS